MPFATDDAPEGEGYVSPRLLQRRIHRLRLPHQVLDTSGPNAYGYSFALSLDGERLAHSHSISFPTLAARQHSLGCYAEMFALADLPAELREPQPGERD